MCSKITWLGKRWITYFTGKRFLTSVGSGMYTKIIGIGKRQIADFTGEWFLASVSSDVPLKIARIAKRKIANTAFVRFLPSMTSHVYLKSKFIFGRIFAHIAFVYARLHGTGSHLLPYFGILKIKKIQVLAIIFNSIRCILASLTLFLQKKSQDFCKEPKTSSWTPDGTFSEHWGKGAVFDQNVFSLKMSFFCAVRYFYLNVPKTLT